MPSDTLEVFPALTEHTYERERESENPPPLPRAMNSFYLASPISTFKKTFFLKIQSHGAGVNYDPDTHSLTITDRSGHGPRTSQVIRLLMFI